MALEDLLARFKPREAAVAPANDAPQAPPADAPAQGGRPEMPQFMKDSFNSPSPPFRSEPMPQGTFAPQHVLSPPMQQGYPQQQASFPQQMAPTSEALEDRISRMESMIKIISDKIDLMSQQVSAVWEAQRRKGI